MTHFTRPNFDPLRNELKQYIAERGAVNLDSPEYSCYLTEYDELTGAFSELEVLAIRLNEFGQFAVLFHHDLEDDEENIESYVDHANNNCLWTTIEGMEFIEPLFLENLACAIEAREKLESNRSL